ncbi:unnamed protein product [Adineta ricciae]|uniref:EGF-like domain-containing protein n=1 Tax=Adineta ricciae TaxID=249248 RepID=A0A815L620_ADIRI|nr:unnamed protein product [Adineta ricciae]
MSIINWVILSLIIPLIVNGESTISYNLPKFCTNATWDENATTFAKEPLLHDGRNSIFISVYNIVYATDYNEHRIFLWFQNKTQITEIKPVQNNPYSLFVTINGDIYVAGNNDGKVDKWVLKPQNSTKVAKFSKPCYGLFIDVTDMLYCSVHDHHIVEKVSLNHNENQSSIVAGTSGSPGNTLDKLHSPHGIFVHTNLSLYVADYANSRIQHFLPGQTSGTTVTGNISLNKPTAIILDGDDNLFIADHENNRIVTFGPHGFRCLFGCYMSEGSTAYQLIKPYSLAFDIEGNIYVNDKNNKRIQKFALISNICNESVPSQNTMTTTILSTDPRDTLEETDIRYNQPIFCDFPSWHPDAITFATVSTFGQWSYGIFITTKNTIYIVSETRNMVTILLENSSRPIRIINSTFSNSTSIFVDSNGNVYVSDRGGSGIDVLTLNGTDKIMLSNMTGYCDGLFVDIENNLYCSIGKQNKIVKKSLNTSSSEWETIIGEGAANQSLSDVLHNPNGIHVDNKHTLYVANHNDHSVVSLQMDTLKFKRVAGKEAPGTILLHQPTAVTLDGNGYIFIVDQGNNRIVGSGPHGFRCVVGCFGSAGSTPYQLSRPWTMGFDSYGNIFVTDVNNNRVQKFILATNSCSLPYNRPKLCPYAAWNPNATTLKTDNIYTQRPFNVFVTSNNTVYALYPWDKRIAIWQNEYNTSINISLTNLEKPFGLFIAIGGDLFVSYTPNSEIVKWALNTVTTISKMNTSGYCVGLFIDINNNIYCSLQGQHQVWRRALNSSNENWTIVAGGSLPGPESHMLSAPGGIFVDAKLNLYVADSGNHRIQCFPPGEKNGTSIVMKRESENITLWKPMGVVLDADSDLYVVDYGGHRIIRSGPNGSRCLVGCSGTSGLDSHKLYQPTMMNFDSYGNMFVVDSYNQSVQKFYLATNSCDPSALIVETSTNIMTTTFTSTSSVQLLDSTTHLITAMQETTVGQSLITFIPKQCNDTSYIGIACNSSSSICISSNPCKNSGTCIDVNNNTLGFVCFCSTGYNGTYCEIDQKPCKPHTCLNHGKCNEASTTTFNCTCADGWQGIHCESLVNYCDLKNITCHSNGICRPLFLNYTCECLGNNYYSGRHCEITSRKITIFTFVSKTFSYIAIIALIVVAMFIIIMDILKYCFGIDPVAAERRKLRREKLLAKRKRVIIQRFTYVNAPSKQLATTIPSITVEHTSVW